MARRARCPADRPWPVGMRNRKFARLFAGGSRIRTPSPALRKSSTRNRWFARLAAGASRIRTVSPTLRRNEPFGSIIDLHLLFPASRSTVGPVQRQEDGMIANADMPRAMRSGASAALAGGGSGVALRQNPVSAVIPSQTDGWPVVPRSFDLLEEP